jgi:hypothetical protein
MLVAGKRKEPSRGKRVIANTRGVIPHASDKDKESDRREARKK